MSRNVVIIGDVIIDRFTYCSALGISSETPTVVAERERTEDMLGGAALISRHLKSLGMTPSLQTLLAVTDAVESVTSDTPRCFSWHATVKHRFFVDGYKMLQVDDLNHERHNDKSRKLLLDSFDHALVELKPSAVVICDQRHGVIDDIVARYVIDKCKEEGVTVLAQSQRSRHRQDVPWRTELFKGVDILLMNEHEAMSVSEICQKGSKFDPDILYDAAHNLEVGTLVVTRGAEGCVVSRRSSPMTQVIDSVRVDVKDTCGAGDALLSFLAFSMALNAQSRYVHTETIENAVRYAALSCTKPGTEVPTADEWMEFSEALSR